MTEELFWTGLSAIAACAAALVAAIQIWFARTEAKRQAAFSHIRDVEERLRSVLHASEGKARADALAFYLSQVDELSKDAAAYLAYLTALDLLLFACERNAIDRSIATTWLRGRLQRDDSTLQFIVELQTACGDPSCFEYYKRHLGHAWQAAVTSPTLTARRAP